MKQMTKIVVLHYLSLPDDVRAHVLSFLSLRVGGGGGCELLNGAALTCRRALCDVTGDLRRREKELVSLAVEDVSWLYRRVPMGYTKERLLNKWKVDLSLSSKAVASGGDGDEPLSQRPWTTMMNEYVSACRPHRFYHELLEGATCMCRKDLITIGTTSFDQRTLTVSTDEYIGDVLITTYLMNSVEMQRDWIHRTLLLLRLSPLAAKNWYRVWVLLHTYLLRFLFWSSSDDDEEEEHEQQQQRQQLWHTLLGLPLPPSLPPTSHIHRPSSSSLLSALFPQELRSDLRLFARTLRGDYAHVCVPRFCGRDFGPLGPAFRGRDMLTSWSVETGVTASVLMDVLSWWEETEKHVEEGMSNDRRDHHQQQQNRRHWRRRLVHEDLEWLRKVHWYTFRNRPMTVDAPTVTFRTSVGT